MPDKLPDMKAVVEEVLALPEFLDKRPAKMDLDDFLALLAAFNARQIHFA
jgi:18S rRNA (adenine1779-N6/adenine1780-N6)-dimethyltransferase